METLERIRDEYRWRLLLDVPLPTVAYLGTEAMQDVLEHNATIRHPDKRAFYIYGILAVHRSFPNPFHIEYAR